MEIYVIRHADAEPLSETITDDAERPLTETGKGQAKAVGQCLQKLGAKVDVILTSPLLRARQTAEGMVAAWTKPAPAVEVVEELADAGKRRKLTKVLRDLGKETVAIVGHQPDLSVYAAWLMGSKKAALELDKAGVALIHCPDGPGRGAGSLAWLVTPDWFASAPRHVD
jgi:phosphohistidine phosphatase